MGWVGVYLRIMENRIKVGSVVFHNNPKGLFKGPGTVTEITHDDVFGVDEYTVMWQSIGETWFHPRSSLMTLAEREARHGS
jgi:hypothetical protein